MTEKSGASKRMLHFEGRSPNLAEMEGFEPPDGLTRQLISSQPRYDHFDTSPYLILAHLVRGLSENTFLSIHGKEGIVNINFLIEHIGEKNRIPQKFAISTQMVYNKQIF